jgi:predicted phage gp36 major capsid-like protein
MTARKRPKMTVARISEKEVRERLAELIPHLFGATSRFPMGQRAIYCYWRTGANVVVPNAFRYLEVK